MIMIIISSSINIDNNTNNDIIIIIIVAIPTRRSTKLPFGHIYLPMGLGNSVGPTVASGSFLLHEERFRCPEYSFWARNVMPSRGSLYPSRLPPSHPSLDEQDRKSKSSPRRIFSCLQKPGSEALPEAIPQPDLGAEYCICSLFSITPLNQYANQHIRIIMIKQHDQILIQVIFQRPGQADRRLRPRALGPLPAPARITAGAGGAGETKTDARCAEPRNKHTSYIKHDLICNIHSYQTTYPARTQESGRRRRWETKTDARSAEHHETVLYKSSIA